MRYKEFILSIITFMLIIRTGNLILKHTKFQSIYSSVSGIILSVMLLSFIMSFKFNINGLYIDNNINNNLIKQNNIKNEFESNLQELIKNDLHNTFYVNTTVTVQTDMKNIIINISGNLSDKTQEVKNYVNEKYCTKGDEVIITNEYPK